MFTVLFTVKYFNALQAQFLISKTKSGIFEEAGLKMLRSKSGENWAKIVGQEEF